MSFNVGDCVMVLSSGYSISTSFRFLARGVNVRAIQQSQTCTKYEAKFALSSSHCKRQTWLSVQFNSNSKPLFASSSNQAKHCYHSYARVVQNLDSSMDEDSSSNKPDCVTCEEILNTSDNIQEMQGILEEKLLSASDQDLDMAKPACQVKHKFDEMTKQPFAIEQASKKQKLDQLLKPAILEESEEEKHEMVSCDEIAEAQDASASSENITDLSMSVFENSVNCSYGSDAGSQSEAQKEGERISGETGGAEHASTYEEEALEFDEELSKDKAEEKPKSNEAAMKEWWEALSKISDMFTRLEACQGSEEFKELVKNVKGKKTKQGKGRNTGKVYPNYFISLQITNEEISGGVKMVQESILEKESELSSAMINPATLHLTLMVMHLTEEQLPKARETLDRVKMKINNSAWVSEQIKICGIGTFRGEVVFGKVEADEGHKQLEFMKDVVSRCYVKDGMPSTDKRIGFNPHLTIMKMSKARKRSKVKKIPAAYYQEFAQLEFGEQPFNELQLCSMTKQKDEHGYYHVEHRIAINKPASQGDGPIYFEKLEKSLDWTAHEPEIDAYPFFGREFPFSNHHDAEFYINGLKFTTSEQWYMLGKAMFHEQYDVALKVLGTSNPKAQKRFCSHLGPEHNGRNWDETSKRVMTIGVAAKFTQNKHLAEKLLNTGDKILVEASPFDCRWGVGLVKTDQRIHNQSLWRGENWLGHILMVIRDGIRKGRLSVNTEDSWKVVWNAQNMPVIVEPEELCDVFTWNADGLPELLNGPS